MEEFQVNRIVHISLKVDDVKRTGDFYQNVFGFQDAETRKTRDHLSRHMTDGKIDFTLMKYDEGTQSAESKASGDGPCIHHFAIEVEDLKKATEDIKDRKSTRLNSSHVEISYAVFCLKKKIRK